VLKRLDNIDVYCRSIEPMEAFYAGVLGLRHNLPYDPGQGWAGFEAGDVTLYLIEAEDGALPHRRGASSPPGIDSFAFEVDDLDAAIAELSARGVEWATDVVESPWYRYRGFYDPEGNLIYVTRPDRAALAGS
jgi:catechol 2,3-dioxygenase-like lactoylglutathione lyase family enzyme